MEWNSLVKLNESLTGFSFLLKYCLMGLGWGDQMGSLSRSRVDSDILSLL